MKNYFVWISVVVLAASAICPPVSDPDLWWHLVVGRWILHHRAVPQVDYWNMFAHGQPWQAYSWSNEVVYAAIDRAGGETGLLLAKFFLASVLVACLGLIFSRVARDWYLGTLLGVITTLAVGDYFGLRPQVVSWICFAFVLFISERITLSGNRLHLFGALLLVMSVWANSHLSSIIGVIAIGLWLVDSAPFKQGASRAAIAMSVALLGTLITPYFGTEWLTAVSKASHPFAHIYIKEFQPATLYQASAGLSLLLFVVALLFMHFQGSFKIVSRSQLVFAVFLTLAGFTVQKFFPYAAIASAFVIAKCWSDQSGRSSSLGKLGLGLLLMFAALKRLGSLSLIGAVALALLCAWVNMRPALDSPVDTRMLPVAALDFVLKNQLESPILTGFNEGGYLLYRLSDSRGNTSQRVAIDGRTNVNQPEVVSAFLSAMYGKSNWRKYLELVNPKTVVWQSDLAFSALLMADGGWQRVYPEDSHQEAPQAVDSSRWSVFVRRQ